MPPLSGARSSPRRSSRDDRAQPARRRAEDYSAARRPRLLHAAARHARGARPLPAPPRGRDRRARRAAGDCAPREPRRPPRPWRRSARAWRSALHDAVAQRVGEMSLQAAGAARVADEDPARALDALAPHRGVGARRARRHPRGDRRPARGTIGGARPARADAPGDARAAGGPRRVRGSAPAAGSAGGSRPPRRRAAGRGGGRRDRVDTLTSSRLEGPPVLNALGVAPSRRRSRSGGAPAARRPPRSSRPRPAVAALTPLTCSSPRSCCCSSSVLGRRAPAARGALAGIAICFAGPVALEPALPTVVIGLAAWARGAGRAGPRERVAELRALTRARAQPRRTPRAPAARSGCGSRASSTTRSPTA